MKKYLIAAFIFISCGIQAQGFRPRVEDMHARKWQYMAEQSNLTPQEAAKVQPIFMEYEKAVWNVLEQNKKYFKKFKEEKRADSKPDFEEMNDRFVNIDIQKAQLLKSYYMKLKKVLPAEKIFNYFNAERSFRKELIKDWRGNRVHDNRP
ncbi:MAG: hypothetical protein WBI53_02455 [Paludibacter sp.]